MHWANIPASRATWYEYNHAPEARRERQELLARIVPVLERIITLELTSRQQQVVALYLRGRHTQVQVAQILCISQPTVSQHLNGKKRAGKKIGGAMRKIRKGIRKQADPLRSRSDQVEILAVLDAMLDAETPRQFAADLLRRLL